MLVSRLSPKAWPHTEAATCYLRTSKATHSSGRSTRIRLRTQLRPEFAFLLLHFHQLKGQVQASRSEFIADFHLGKDLLYAELNLKDSQTRALFSEMHGLFLERSPLPSLVIFLSASTDLLVERIRTRKRDFELGIDAGYYHAVNVAYEEYFSRYCGKKLRIPMDEWDFVQNPSLYERLAALVDGELNSK